MTHATGLATTLAYDDEGAGTPVVFLHGLTFDRSTWRPIVERLDRSIRSVAIDLPAQGESSGAPGPFEEIATQIHDLLASLVVDRPVVVGHSMSGGLASLYAATYPVRGVVVIDNGPHIRPFAKLVQQLEPALRGPGFREAWRGFEDSLGIERLPEPLRSHVLQTYEVKQDVILAYWETLLRADPDQLQASIDTQIRKLDVPLLGIFGRPISASERERFSWLPDVQLVESVGDGHFVHLVDPDRFTALLRKFVDHCTAAG